MSRKLFKIYFQRFAFCGSSTFESWLKLGSSGNWSKRPKVMSHEVMSPETRVKSPEMLSHVARILSGENKECV